ncbi:MAG: hypothetical protein R6V67_11810 [Spirochaetia bacterium]
MRQKSPAVFLFFGLFFAFVFPAGADTVMVYTEKAEGDGDVEMSRGYLEDGVMEGFFDAGHIVFNAYPEMDEANSEPEDFSEKFSVRAAKDGGATLLLEIAMKFDSSEENSLPDSASYRYYDLDSGDLLARGEADLPEEDDDKELKEEEKLNRLGSAVVESVLGKK